MEWLRCLRRGVGALFSVSGVARWGRSGMCRVLVCAAEGSDASLGEAVSGKCLSLLWVLFQGTRGSVHRQQSSWAWHRSVPLPRPTLALLPHRPR